MENYRLCLVTVHTQSGQQVYNSDLSEAAYGYEEALQMCRGLLMSPIVAEAYPVLDVRQYPCEQCGRTCFDRIFGLCADCYVEARDAGRLLDD